MIGWSGGVLLLFLFDYFLVVWVGVFYVFGFLIVVCVVLGWMVKCVGIWVLCFYGGEMSC